MLIFKFKRFVENRIWPQLTNSAQPSLSWSVEDHTVASCLYITVINIVSHVVNVLTLFSQVRWSIHNINIKGTNWRKTESFSIPSCIIMSYDTNQTTEMSICLKYRYPYLMNTIWILCEHPLLTRASLCRHHLALELGLGGGEEISCPWGRTNMFTVPQQIEQQKSIARLRAQL